VTALSACGLLALFLLPYHRPHTSVVIPNFVGSLLPTQDPSSIRILVEYEYNPLVSPGTVIAQSPLAGVTRRVYGSNGFCTVLLRVSKERDTYRLEDLSGRTMRDATLILANHKIQSTVVEEFSDTHPAGTVLSTMPTAGQELKEGATVTLRVSMGRQIQIARVPNLLGLTESAANSLLHSGGFRVGTVTYRSSSSPSGTIISQTPTDHTEVEKGATVSYTVSTGNLYDTKAVPDLYGMTQSEASRVLREYGLVIGACFPVASAAPKGTVITQSPLPGTPITSSTVSVDLYLSS
jgi:serine/threonine-protein kinase